MLFCIDESGIGDCQIPYIVLACVSIAEDKAWPLILAQRELKSRFLVSFDPRMTVPRESQEPKTSDLLRRQAFKLAGNRPWFPDSDIEGMIRSAREHPGRATPAELQAANQGKIRYVEELLNLCRSADMKVFATVTERYAPEQSDRTFLGKDFSFLFQRLHAYLEQQAPGKHGLLIFDERDDAFSKRLIGQMHRYFTGTSKGKTSAARVLPAPLFAKSHLMPLVQVADVTAYIINWAFRAGPIMASNRRDELVYLALRVKAMQFEGTRVDRFAVREMPLWGIQYIADLRPLEERAEEGES
jgi:hypothetical protein